MTRSVRWLAAGLAVLYSGLTVAPRAHAADAITLQGSSTFYRELVKPHRKEVERLSGHRLSVISSKSVHGLMALIEGRTQIAMISSSLQGEIDHIGDIRPNVDTENLKVFPVSMTRVAFVHHPDITVQKLTNAQLADILLGKFASWKDVGGADVPITFVTVQPGGGVPTTVRRKVLDGKSFKAKRMVVVEAPIHVLQVTRQLPGALGLTQLELAEQEKLSEIKLDQKIEQELNLVTRGEATPDQMDVIKAFVAVATRYLN